MCELPASGTVTKKTVKGRKQYKCVECNHVIEKGQEHESFKACWPSIDGWATFRTCLRCVKVKKLANKKYGSIDWFREQAFGTLFESIREARRY